MRRIRTYVLRLLRQPSWGIEAARIAYGTWRRHGLPGIAALLFPARFSASLYRAWIKRYETATAHGEQRIRDRIAALSGEPPVSVLLPLTGTEGPHWRSTIDSVRAQCCPHWELCVAVDAMAPALTFYALERFAAQDARIRWVRCDARGKQSALLNHCMQIASGDLVLPIGADALLSAQALYRVMETFQQRPQARLIYSDEDRLGAGGERHSPRFKCRWNPDLFLSMNMVGNLVALRSRLVRELGGFREEFEGAHDYDLLLRGVERLQPFQIVHIPRVLYHRRSNDEHATNAAAQRAGAAAIRGHLERTGVAATVEPQPDGNYRVRYALPALPPLVTLIIPTRNALDLLKRCVGSVRERTDYPRYEILIVDNGSDDPDALAYLDRLRDVPDIRVLRDPRPFNFPALNNAAVVRAQGGFIGLLNNDVEIISPDWLREMVSLASQPGVGAVGARLWYPDGTLQHGGVVLGYGGGAGHAHKRLRRGDPGNQGRAEVLQGFSAVTAACLVVRKDRFLEAGGFNEDLPVNFNDVDLGLKLRELGYRNVWTPFAELYHRESATRGTDDTPAKRARFARELAYIQTRWRTWLADDPAYSPNLTLEREDFSLAWPPRVREPADAGDVLEHARDNRLSSPRTRHSTRQA